MKDFNEQKADEKLNMFLDDARKLFGTDDESAFDEWEAAELSWEQEKLENPEEARKIEDGADAGFEALMQKIAARQLEREMTAEEEKEAVGKGLQNGEEAECFIAADAGDTTEETIVSITGTAKRRRLSGKRRVLLLVAAVGVMVVGMSMAATGTRKYNFRQYQLPDDKTKVVNRNANLTVVKEGKLDKAYEQIGESLGIPVLVLSDMPTGLQFKCLSLGKEQAILEFTYNNRFVYFEEAKMLDETGRARMLVSDRKSCGKVYNAWLDKEIEIEANLLEEGQTEYSAWIELSESYYYLSGIMEKEQFTRLVEGLTRY